MGSLSYPLTLWQDKIWSKTVYCVQRFFAKVNATILALIEALMDEPAEIRPLIDLDSPLSESQQRAAESSLSQALCQMGIIKPSVE
jgi:hypothetical protein